MVWGLGISTAAPLKGQSFEQARDHWAYRPLDRPAMPGLRDSGRVSTPVDAFLLARLEAAGRSYAAPADARTIWPLPGGVEPAAGEITTRGGTTAGRDGVVAGPSTRCAVGGVSFLPHGLTLNAGWNSWNAIPGTSVIGSRRWGSSPIPTAQGGLRVGPMDRRLR